MDSSSIMDAIRRSILCGIGLSMAMSLSACVANTIDVDGDAGTGDACEPEAPAEGDIIEVCLTELPPEVASCGECDIDCVQWWVDRNLPCPGEAAWPETVECEPVPQENGECCVTASSISTTFCAAGRPLVVDGRARTASRATRSDWSQALAPDTALPRGTREALADAWTRQALAEHASIASFARFVMELLAVGAPADLVGDAQLAIADELEHARACFAFASAYAEAPVGPGAVDVTGAIPATDLRTAVLAAVREGCIGETLAAIECRVASESATDPVVRDALARIAEDETRHAQLAWRFVRWALERDPSLAAEVADAFAEARVEPDDAPDSVGLRAHGQLERAERISLHADGLRQVILPCARTMLSPNESSAVATA